MSQKCLHLQGLRGIAIFAVILVHFFPEKFPNGFLGVDLFFVLSGYLMCMMMNRTPSSLTSTLDFIYRRIRRIMPLYYLFILLALIFFPFFFRSEYLQETANGAFFAISLQTNLKEIRSSSVYEQQMRMGVDIFLHTWSLCLELQYYILYPFIHVCIGKYQHISSIVIGISITYYFISTPIVAFNSVWARIWQFIIGSVAYQQEASRDDVKSRKEEHTLPVDRKDDCLVQLIENDVQSTEGEKCESDHIRLPLTTHIEKNISYLTYLSILLLLYTLLSPVKYEPNYSRISSTVLAWVVVSFGSSNRVLSAAPLVFLGEISYALYLVHWPIVSFIRINQGLREHDDPLGIAISLCAAMAIHFGFERIYLKWDRKLSICVIVVLFLSCILEVEYTNILSEKLAGTDTLQRNELSYYKNLTTEELIEINKEDTAKDQQRLLIPSCDYEKQNTWHSFCTVKNEIFSGRKKMLVMGNSWTANVGQVVIDQCKPFTSQIFIQAIPSCEVFVRTQLGFCSSFEPRLFTAVERVKPDVLILADRHITMAVQPKSQPDPMIAEIQERMKKIIKFVSDKIYIVGSFPNVSNKMLPGLISHLQNNTNISQEDFYSNDTIPIVEERLSHILKICPQCELIDYKPQFTKNGQFQVFDPETGLGYLTGGLHFTPFGLNLLHPLYKELCEKFK